MPIGPLDLLPHEVQVSDAAYVDRWRGCLARLAPPVVGERPACRSKDAKSVQTVWSNLSLSALWATSDLGDTNRCIRNFFSLIPFFAAHGLPQHLGLFREACSET